MNIISVTGRKGGIGKSTITGNLAVEFLNMGLSVVVLDTDPQQSLMQWAKLGDGVLVDLVQVVETDQPEEFRRIVQQSEKDIVLIDTPPGFSDPALLSALVADIVLLPAGPSPLDILPAQDALALAQQAVTERNDNKPIIRFVPNRYSSNTRLGADLPETLADMGETLPGIRQRTVIAESTLSGLTVREFAPSSPAVDEFQTLAKNILEVLKREHKSKQPAKRSSTKNSRKT